MIRPSELLVGILGTAISAQAFALQKGDTEFDAKTSASELHQTACAISPYVGDDPWHITNLYDCGTKELFIPYQLWTGAQWGGDKNKPCEHVVNNTSLVLKPENAVMQYGNGKVIIKGTKTWTHPDSGEQLKVFERHRPHRNAVSYYECHDRGIGKVHNPRKPDGRWVRGLCHAPGGEGWMVGKRRTCVKTTLEVVNVTLDADARLKSISVKYWYRDTLKYRHTYEREKGTVEILQLDSSK